MLHVDPSPWLLLAVPFFALNLYMAHRGFVRNQFRVPGKWGWATYPTWSFDWLVSTATNLTLLGASIAILYWTTLEGAQFSKEPQLSIPEDRGELYETVHSTRTATDLARCVAELNHGQVYSQAANGWLVVVRNGGGRSGGPQVMYTFDVVPKGSGSTMEVRRSIMTPFVSWSRCV